MGHDSENLLQEPSLLGFQGAILSPVNYTRNRVEAQIDRMRAIVGYEMIFDPQLYYPQTQRGVLRDWAYFPLDVDTADWSADAWWFRVVDSLVATVEPLRPDGICSPAIIPRVWNNSYYASMVRVGDYLTTRLRGTGIRTLQTTPVDLASLTERGRALAIASIVSRTKADAVYLIIVGNVDPRREIGDTEGLKAAMRLIQALETAGLPVLVGFCSSDMLLWKAAGATSVASGKFFNLRRFTPSRFEEPTGGGGQLSYWFEEALVAFLRESDLLRVTPLGLISDHSRVNPYGIEIINHLASNPGRAWVARGWRQFLHWFANAERRISAGQLVVPELLREAELRWRDLEDRGVLMEEPRNDGSWIRPWRRAIAEYRSL